MGYCLLDLRRRSWGVKSLVCWIEQGVIDYLAAQGIIAERQPGAPGVYVKGAKIASLGFRITQGYCYHGVCLNVNLDLSVFRRINPCGFVGLEMTQLSDLLPEDPDFSSKTSLSISQIGLELLTCLRAKSRSCYNPPL